MNDPYPQNLESVDGGYSAPVQAPSFEGELLRVLNRIANALERGSQPVQNAPQRPLQALPPIQTQRPACPYHGIDKVAPSTNGKGGFYCQAKGGPDVNAKGYCRWHS